MLEQKGDSDRRQRGQNDCEKLKQKKSIVKGFENHDYHFRFNNILLYVRSYV